MSKVSVVIPIYNRADLILETLLSVENQTYVPFEVIIVDDGSTDNSLEVIRAWREKSKLNSHIFSNQNTKGPSGALNFGIAKASGEYIAMQDSDDLWTSCHLQQLVGALADFPQYDIAFSKIQVFGTAKDVLEKNDAFLNSVAGCLKIAFEKKTTLLWASSPKLFYTLLQGGVPFRCQASLIRRSFFDKTNIGFDEEITYCQDAQFMTQAAYNTGYIYIDNTGLCLRRHAENDGDLCYGDKIWKSYEKRAEKLKQYFSNKPLNKLEKSALAYRLVQLQTHVFIAKIKKFGFRSLLKECFNLLKAVPSFSTIVLIIKIVIKYFFRIL